MSLAVNVVKMTCVTHETAFGQLSSSMSLETGNRLRKEEGSSVPAILKLRGMASGGTHGLGTTPSGPEPVLAQK